MQNYGQQQGAGPPAEGDAGGGGRRFARGVVRSWENYGQGLVCLACPPYASYVLWREKRRVRKELGKLRRDIDELWRRRNDQWHEVRGAPPKL
ncbi:hypothetical protein F4780DRAFT_756448 [Xylariomycetidae sp. FL0641]|nr:hypothetical protein F4780DRAFT_756448 [Xylariomycetidae sp. FL0641]